MKDRRSPLVHSRKLAEHGNFTRAVSRRYRDRGQRKENPDRAKNQSDWRICYRALLEKINIGIFPILSTLHTQTVFAKDEKLSETS